MVCSNMPQPSTQDDAVFAHDEAIIYLRENRTTVATTVSDLPGLRAQADQD